MLCMYICGAGKQEDDIRNQEKHAGRQASNNSEAQETNSLIRGKKQEQGIVVRTDRLRGQRHKLPQQKRR